MEASWQKRWEPVVTELTHGLMVHKKNEGIDFCWIVVVDCFEIDICTFIITMKDHQHCRKTEF